MPVSPRRYNGTVKWEFEGLDMGMFGRLEGTAVEEYKQGLEKEGLFCP
jgi:hypothetical protein